MIDEFGTLHSLAEEAQGTFEGNCPAPSSSRSGGRSALVPPGLSYVGRLRPPRSVLFLQ